MLVFDATNKKSRLNLNEWLVEVSQKGNEKDLDAHINVNVPTITIGTKKDQLPYKALMEIENEARFAVNRSPVRDANSSVVNFDMRPTTTRYRRLHMQPESDQDSSFLSSLNTSSMSSSFMHSTPTQSTTSLSEPLLGSHQPVIYVNTQDVLSFSQESDNFAKLVDFFRTVIERRNKRFYNKFVI